MSEGAWALQASSSVIVPRILITGASSGIGEATAYAYSNPECELLLVARREQRLAEVAEACLKKGVSRVVFKARDLSVPGQGATIVEECLEELGGLDLLICNAGYGIYGPLQEVSPQDMARIWQVNFQSGYESIHAAVPHLVKQKEGHIVLVSSIIGKKAFSYAASYCATKFAQVAIGEALWGELRGTGVGVSVICPGYTATEFSAIRSKDGQSKILEPPGKWARLCSRGPSHCESGAPQKARGPSHSPREDSLWVEPNLPFFGEPCGVSGAAARFEEERQETGDRRQEIGGRR